MDSETRFSSSFLDELDITVQAIPAQSDTQNTLAVSNGTDKEKRFSDHFTETDTELHLHPHDEQFDFASNLQTHDSVSSLNELVPSEPTGGAGESGGVDLATSHLSGSWETFNENGQKSSKTDEPSQPEAPIDVQVEVKNAGEEAKVSSNGTSASAPSESKGKWEKFDDSGESLSKKLSAAAIDTQESGTVCAADALVSDSRWTALEDSHNLDVEDERSWDDGNLPFRKVQSMRATTNRKIQIVDALRQRRLSNSSLDREPGKNLSQFKNEDELTRKFKVERDWQVYVKMDKRVPGTKSKWLAVNLSVKEGILVIKKSTPPSMPISSSTVVPPDAPPLHEIQLHHNHTLTKPLARRYNRKTKLHQIKLQITQIQEKRTLKRWLFVEHISKARTIVKLGCQDATVVQSLSDQISESIRMLPVTRVPGVSYRMNEVFIDVKDNSDILMNCDGAVLERKSLNRIFVQAFLSGANECSIILNDIEALLLQGKGQLSMSMSRQVRLNNVVLHPCVDKTVYKNTREIKFQPIDGYPFELLRASIDPYVSPPVTVSMLMEYSEQRNTVRITASFNIRKKHNLRLRPIKDLVIKFPIPSSWSSQFLAETTFGAKKSVRSTSVLRGSFRRKIKSSSCQIETQLGSARYEPAYGAVMWRIGNYVESPVLHNFRCDVELKPGMYKPDVSSEHAEVSYSIPGSSTGLQIRSFKAEKAKTQPERWVKYEIQYRYKVQMFPDLSID